MKVKDYIRSSLIERAQEEKFTLEITGIDRGTLQVAMQCLFDKYNDLPEDVYKLKEKLDTLDY